ncbi:MAG: magnesium-dependent phosphatase-1 [Verrucomicrobiota bacterium]|nr:magnesium-dependent phosphatase-1 [Verrucomicrobiota bacterium]MEE2968142.1 magnesium-dependent phosphatase-1 [Verrucomicrobiota bacterium]
MKPKLVVFDLDFTLWDAAGTWCDHLYPPFKIRSGRIFDSKGSELKLYPGTIDILEELKYEHFDLGIASRTNEPDWARELLDLLNVRDYFRYEEIYPGSKVTHFKRLRNKSGLNYEDMIFFDDEQRNITEVGDLGVNCILVKNGISPSLVLSCLAK